MNELDKEIKIGIGESISEYEARDDYNLGYYIGYESGFKDGAQFVRDKNLTVLFAQWWSEFTLMNTTLPAYRSDRFNLAFLTIQEGYDYWENNQYGKA